MEESKEKKSSFGADALKLASAPLLTQIIGFFTLPIVTRLYTAEDLGLFSVFRSVVAPAIVFLCLGYEPSIVLPKTDKEASNIFGLSILCTLVNTLVAIVIVAGLSDFFIETFDLRSDLKPFLWLLPVYLFFGGISSASRYWNLRSKGFGRIAIANISSTSIDRGIALSAGFSGFASGFSLIIAGAAEAVSRPIILFAGVWKNYGRFILKSLSWKEIGQVLKKYRKFPFFILPTNVLARLTAEIPVLMLFTYFSDSVVGQYALGLRMLNLPMSLIGNSVGEVYYQRESGKEKRDITLLNNLFKRLVLIGIFPFMLLGVVGEELFALIFGADWGEAGVFVQFLSIMIFVRFIVTPASYLSMLLQKQEYSLLLNVFTLGVTVVAIVVGGTNDSIYLTLSLMTGLNVLVYGLFGFGLMYHAGLSFGTMIKTLGRFFVIAAPLIGTLWLLKDFGLLPLTLLLILTFIFTIIYFAIALRYDAELFRLIGEHGITKKLGISRWFKNRSY